MNLFTAVLATLALLASSSTEAQTPVITRGGTRAVRPFVPGLFARFFIVPV